MLIIFDKWAFSVGEYVQNSYYPANACTATIYE
jgi:hypothetical protein